MMETKTLKPAATGILHAGIPPANKNTNKDAEEEQPDMMVIPEQNDVLLGRGRTNFWHEGNVRFRQIIGSHLQTYLVSVSRSQKSRVVRQIADEVLTGARCLKQSPSAPFHWYNAGVKAAREKIGHALRDACADKSRGIKEIHLDLLAKKSEAKRRKKVVKCMERERRKKLAEDLNFNNPGTSYAAAQSLNNADIMAGAMAMSRLPGVNVPDTALSSPRSQPAIANGSLARTGRMYTNPNRTVLPLAPVPSGLAALESAIRLQEAAMDSTSYGAITASETERDDSLSRPSPASSSHYKMSPPTSLPSSSHMLFTQPAPARIKRIEFRSRKYPVKIVKSWSSIKGGVAPSRLDVHQQLSACHPVREFSFATKMGLKGNPFQTRTYKPGF